MFFLNPHNVEMVEVLNANARGQLAEFHPAPMQKSARMPTLGLTPTIRTAYHQVAEKYNCLIFIRETGTASAYAFYYGLGTGKPLDVKGKSSVATFTYGNIPFFARLSKTVTKSFLQPAAFISNQNDLIHQADNPDYSYVPRFITQSELYTNHYQENKPFAVLEPRVDDRGQLAYQDVFYYLAKTTFSELKRQIPAGTDLFNLSRRSLSTTDTIYQVYIRADQVMASTDATFWADKGDKLTHFAPTLSVGGQTFYAVYVLAQKLGSAYYEMVADYDLFAICPSIETVLESPGDTWAEKVARFMPNGQNHEKGILSPFEVEIGQALNEALTKVGPSLPPPKSQPTPTKKPSRTQRLVLSTLATPFGEEAPTPESRQQLLEDIDSQLLYLRQVSSQLGPTTPSAVLHGCETNNYFHTVPYDFDNLICIRPVSVGRHELPAVPPTGYFELLLQRPTITAKATPTERGALVEGVNQIGRAYIFPINLAWGLYTIGQANSDFVSQVAKPINTPTNGTLLLKESLATEFKTLSQLYEDIKVSFQTTLLDRLRKKKVTYFSSPETKSLRAGLIAMTMRLLYLESYYQALPAGLNDFGAYLLAHGKIPDKVAITTRQGWCAGPLPIIKEYKGQLASLMGKIIAKKWYETDNLYHFDQVLGQLQQLLG